VALPTLPFALTTETVTLSVHELMSMLPLMVRRFHGTGL
jgi:hypothetical protein